LKTLLQNAYWQCHCIFSLTYDGKTTSAELATTDLDGVASISIDIFQAVLIW